MYICFEGSDGTGKTTLVDKTVELLRSQKQEVVVAKNPGATALGQKLRHLIKHDTEIEVDPLTERLLYLCDNSCFVNTLLRPSLFLGKTVVADRCNIIGDLMYAEASGIDLNQIYILHSILGDIPKIDKLFVLWCPWDVAKGRMFSRNDALKCKIEAKGDIFFRQVCDKYYELYGKMHLTTAMHVEKYVKIIIPIDASKSPDEVWDQVKANL